MATDVENCGLGSQNLEGCEEMRQIGCDED